jgi:hypothetical protein
MKKTYIFPEVKVVNIKAQNILAGSLDAELQNGGTLNTREGGFSDDLFDTGDVLDTDQMLN